MYVKKNQITVFITLLLTVLIVIFSTELNDILLTGSKLKATVIGLLYMSVIYFVLISLYLKVVSFFGLSPTLIIISFIVIFYSSGLFPLSLYRSYIETNFWIGLLSVAVLCILIGNFIGKFLGNKGEISEIKNNKVLIINKNVVVIFSLLSLLATGYITLRYGLLIINPSNRFLVPASIQYIVEFIIPVTISVFAYYYDPNKKNIKVILYAIMSILMLFSLGYRNQPMLVIIGCILVFVFKKFNGKTVFEWNKIIKLSLGGMVLLVVFSLLFILRQESSTELLDWSSFVNFYQVNYYQLSMPIFPFHLSSREAMGVTTIALERIGQINSLLNNSSFFFQDLKTLLPGAQLTAGNILGRVVNLRDSVSLTPGLLGGLYISNGLLGLSIGFAAIGFLLSYYWHQFKRTNSHRSLALVVLALIYSLELVNRGIFKPMYIIVLVIPYFLFYRKRAK